MGRYLARRVAFACLLVFVVASASLVLVEPSPMTMFVGKSDAGHLKGLKAAVSIWAGPLGAETDTLLDQGGVYNRFGDIPAGKWVRCVWNDTLSTGN